MKVTIIAYHDLFDDMVVFKCVVDREEGEQSEREEVSINK